MNNIVKSLSNYGYTLQEYLDLIYQQMLEDSQTLSNAVDNDCLDLGVINQNSQTIVDAIHVMLSKIDKYFENNEFISLDELSRVKEYKEVLKNLETKFKHYTDMIMADYDTKSSSLSSHIFNEGIFSNLANMATSMPKFSRVTKTKLDRYLEPYTVNELYDGIVNQLRLSSNSIIKSEIMPIFFPKNNKKIKNEGIFKYKQKMEDVIIQFIVDECTELIEKTLDEYTQHNSNIPESDYYGKFCVGLILNSVKNNEHNLENKLIEIYKDYKSQHSSNTVDNQKSERSVKKLTDIQKELYDALYGMTSVNKEDLIRVVSKINETDRESAMLQALQKLNTYLKV